MPLAPRQSPFGQFVPAGAGRARRAPGAGSTEDLQNLAVMQALMKIMGMDPGQEREMETMLQRELISERSATTTANIGADVQREGIAATERLAELNNKSAMAVLGVTAALQDRRTALNAAHDIHKGSHRLAQEVSSLAMADQLPGAYARISVLSKVASGFASKFFSDKSAGEQKGGVQGPGSGGGPPGGPSAPGGGGSATTQPAAGAPATGRTPEASWWTGAAKGIVVEIPALKTELAPLNAGNLTGEYIGNGAYESLPNAAFATPEEVVQHLYDQLTKTGPSGMNPATVRSFLVEAEAPGWEGVNAGSGTAPVRVDPVTASVVRGAFRRFITRAGEDSDLAEPLTGIYNRMGLTDAGRQRAFITEKLRTYEQIGVADAEKGYSFDKVLVVRELSTVAFLPSVRDHVVKTVAGIHEGAGEPWDEYQQHQFRQWLAGGFAEMPKEQQELTKLRHTAATTAAAATLQVDLVEEYEQKRSALAHDIRRFDTYYRVRDARRQLDIVDRTTLTMMEHQPGAVKVRQAEHDAFNTLLRGAEREFPDTDFSRKGLPPPTEPVWDKTADLSKFKQEAQTKMLREATYKQEGLTLKNIGAAFAAADPNFPKSKQPATTQPAAKPTTQPAQPQQPQGPTSMPSAVSPVSVGGRS